MFFRVAARGQVAAAIEGLNADALVKRHTPRFIMATDGSDVLCRDTKADRTLDIAYGKLNDGFDFFLPLAGIERYEAVAENPADVKATGRLAKLYDAILEANPGWVARGQTHELNLFMTRLLFCFFAEDTSIFGKGLFSGTILSLTKQDGSDTAAVLETLFSAMDARPGMRDSLPKFAKELPYVNGGLFAERTAVPTFSARARRLLKDCGDLCWQDINPDIFGSMIQAVVDPGMRGDMGMHYTSVPNIMKVLQPLFLLSLEEELEAAGDSEVKLGKLLDRLYRIRVFDPACGSGNFLIIAYRELRKLENRIFARLKIVARQWSLPLTGIKLNHFYGIELADFAVETAKLALWITEYQMNEQFKLLFGPSLPTLPLRESGNIIHGNAPRVDWLDVCPLMDEGEVYIVGNPPYLGSTQQNETQKHDLCVVFGENTGAYKKLDYVACWFMKAANYCLQAQASFAFVSTNSICQGEQVALLWPPILRKNLEIGFARQSFKWRNNAAKNAGVSCIIVGIRPVGEAKKIIFSGEVSRIVKNIGPYLVEMEDIAVTKRARPLSLIKAMDKGNQPTDDGNLILVLLCHFLISAVGFGLQATWASWQVLDEANGEPAANRGNRVRHMALRPDGRPLLAGSLGVAQVPRSARGQIAAEGGKDSARLPKSHTLRCTGWHGGESRASRGPQSGRARSLA